MVRLSHVEHIDVHAMARLIIDESLCLRKQGVTMVVLLSHGGIAADKQLTQLTRGYVDVILGGHSHVEVSCKGQWHSDDMVVLHSGYNGESYGVVNVEVNANGFAISTDVIQLHTSMKADAELESWYRKKYLSLNLSTEVLYTFDSSVTKRQSCRSMPCETGRLINAAVRQYFNCSSDLVGLFESGSIRGRFLGNITDSDIARVLPWANKMVVLSLRGHTFLEMLRYSNASMETGAYLQVMGFADTTSKQVSESCSFCQDQIDWNDISHTRNYSIVVTDWLANGGDGYMKYYLGQSEILYQSNDSIQDIIRAFFKSEPSLSCNNSDASSSIHHKMSIVEGSADSIERIRASSSSNSAANIVVNSWWIQGFIGLTADSVGLLLSYPFLIHSVRQQAAAAPATLPSPASLTTTSYSFDDPISNYCNTCSYYYNGFLLVFIARSITSWLFWAVYQYLLNNIGRYPNSLLL